MAQPPDLLACPVCDSTQTSGLLRRQSVPVHQNLLYPTAQAARSATLGELELRICESCGFIFNAAFDGSLLDYGQAYDNTQTHSPAFNLYVDGLVAQLVVERGVEGRFIVEVGCGKGTFLEKLISYPGANNTGLGFDPTYVGPETRCNGRLRFDRRFYGPETAVAADVVVCRHVIEHVSRPAEFLCAIRRALPAVRPSRIFFETPCVEWILERGVVWDFFYEHCSLFTAHSLAVCVRRAGFHVGGVQHVFGGQYLWLEADTSAAACDEETTVIRLVGLAREYGQHEARQTGHWRRLLAELSAQGSVAVWGAGAKGATCCNLIDPDRRMIQCVVDVNPAKQGKYIAGTGHRIIAPSQVTREGITHVLVLNPNYVGEVRHQLATLGSPAVVLDLMETEVTLHEAVH